MFLRGKDGGSFFRIAYSSGSYQILSFGINFNTHSFMVKKQRLWKIFFDDTSSVAKFMILEKKWQINLNIKFQSKNFLKELPNELQITPILGYILKRKNVRGK